MEDVTGGANKFLAFGIDGMITIKSTLKDPRVAWLRIVISETLWRFTPSWSDIVALTFYRLSGRVKSIVTIGLSRSKDVPDSQTSISLFFAVGVSGTLAVRLPLHRRSRIPLSGSAECIPFQRSTQSYAPVSRRVQGVVTSRLAPSFPPWTRPRLPQHDTTLSVAKAGSWSDCTTEEPAFPCFADLGHNMVSIIGFVPIDRTVFAKRMI